MVNKRGVRPGSDGVRSQASAAGPIKSNRISARSHRARAFDSPAKVSARLATPTTQGVDPISKEAMLAFADTRATLFTFGGRSNPRKRPTLHVNNRSPFAPARGAALRGNPGLVLFVGRRHGEGLMDAGRLQGLFVVRNMERVVVALARPTLPFQRRIREDRAVLSEVERTSAATANRFYA